MFRLLMMVAFILLLWIQSFFTQTVHHVNGDHHVFAYGPMAWFFLAAFVAVMMGFAVLAWKWLRDAWGAVILAVGAVFIGGILMPTLLSQRVELTKELWKNRREWPHQKYIADVPWNEITQVTKVRREDQSFGQRWHIGYELSLKDGSHVEFPSSEALTAAEATVDGRLQQHHIPMNSRDILVPPAQ